MTIIKILNYPNIQLKRVAPETKNFANNKVIQTIIDNMLETLKNTNGAAALAATQLDIPDPPRCVVISGIFFKDSDKTEKCFINPTILETTGNVEDYESCMSIYPGYIHAKVHRAKKIMLHALDRFENKIEFEAENFLARVFQHEIDHLDGIIYLDHLSSLKRKLIDAKIKIAINKQK